MENALAILVCKDERKELVLQSILILGLGVVDEALAQLPQQDFSRIFPDRFVLWIFPSGHPGRGLRVLDFLVFDVVETDLHWTG